MMSSIDSPFWRTVILVLALIGLAIASYLVITDISGGEAVCTADGSCESVTGSAWGELFGAPVSLFGAIAYFVITLAAASELLIPEKVRPDSSLAQVLLTATGLTFSIYLTVVAATQIGSFCIWCLGSLAIMAALFSLSLGRALRHSV